MEGTTAVSASQAWDLVSMARCRTDPSAESGEDPENKSVEVGRVQ